MAYLIDRYEQTKTEIDGKWWIARPKLPPFIVRLKDAWLVLIGEADAVTFYKEGDFPGAAHEPLDAKEIKERLLKNLSE